MKNYCGLDCAQCPAVDGCPGCAALWGHLRAGGVLQSPGLRKPRQLLFRKMRLEGAAHKRV